MKATCVDHIGIVVSDIDSSLPLYCDVLGLAFEGIEHNEAYNVDIAFFRLGETLVELIQPKGPGSFSDFLRSKRGGLHHVAFRVDGVLQALQALKERNVPLVDEYPRDGGGGAKIAFLDDSAANNVSVELVER